MSKWWSTLLIKYKFLVLNTKVEWHLQIYINKIIKKARNLTFEVKYTLGPKNLPRLGSIQPKSLQWYHKQTNSNIILDATHTYYLGSDPIQKLKLIR